MAYDKSPPYFIGENICYWGEEGCFCIIRGGGYKTYPENHNNPTNTHMHP